MSKEEFKATPIYVVPIFASLVVGAACAYMILQSGVELTYVTVLPETGYGPIFNAAMFVLAALTSATVIYFFLKHNVHRLIFLLMGFALSALAFLLTIFYSELALALVNIEVPSVGILLLAVLASFVVVFEVFLRKGKVSGIIVLMFGGAMGALLGATIPLFSAIFILLLLSVYDVFAVYRGPVGKIAMKGLEHLPGASFSFKDIYIGLGDLTFYAMLVSRVLLSFGWEACTAAMVGILLGSFFSFKMVEKRGMFPGLPFSVLLGLLAGLVVGWGLLGLFT